MPALWQARQLCRATSIDMDAYRDDFFEVAKADAVHSSLNVSSYLSKVLQRAALRMNVQSKLPESTGNSRE